MDQQNIAKNKQYGIETPKDPVTSFGTVFSSVISNKLQQAGPIISIVTSKLGGLSGGSSSAGKDTDSYGDNGGNGGSGGSAGGFLGTIGALLGGASGSGSKGNNGGDNGYQFGTES